MRWSTCAARTAAALGVVGLLAVQAGAAPVKQTARPAKATPEEIASAKQAVRMLRSFSTMAVALVGNDTEGLQADLTRQQEQTQAALGPVTQVMARLQWMARIVGLSIDQSGESLVGRAPGAYDLEPAKGKEGASTAGAMVRTGGGPDDRSWVITSHVKDETEGTVTTITPSNPVTGFVLGPEPGTLTVSVRKPGDPKLKYDGRVDLDVASAGLPIRVATAWTLADKNLTKPLQFDGAVWAANNASPGSALQIGIAGTISSAAGTASFDSFTMDWSEDGNPAAPTIRIAGLKMKGSGPTRAMAQIERATIETSPPDPDSGASASVPKRVTLTGAFGFGSRTLTERELVITFQRVPVLGLIPATLAGGFEYRSDEVFTFKGRIDARATGLAAGESLGFSVRLVGELLPVRDPAAQVDATVQLTLAPKPALRISLAKLSSRGQSVAGDIAVPLEEGALAVSLKHTPTGMVIVLEGPPEAPHGSIYRDASHAVKLADIGKGADLGVKEGASDSFVVKYADGTHEAAAPLLQPK